MPAYRVTEEGPGGLTLPDGSRVEPGETTSSVPSHDVAWLLAAGYIEPADGAKSDVPDGTKDEILDWVGDDPERAAAAYRAEESGKGRKTVFEALSGLLADATDEES